MPLSWERWSGGSGRRSGMTDIFHNSRDPEVQERAMQLAESLIRHELLKRTTKKFIYFKRVNLMKLLLMVISLCSFFILWHADFHSEFYPIFLVQLGTSTAVFPSIFRVSTMFLRLNLASPIIVRHFLTQLFKEQDILIVLIILVHHSMAAITLLLTNVNTRHPNSKDLLYFNAALLIAGAIICLTEIGSVVFSAQLHRRSSSWASSTRDDDPRQPAAALL